jgi:hypothetical protein
MSTIALSTMPLYFASSPLVSNVCALPVESAGGVASSGAFALVLFVVVVVLVSVLDVVSSSSSLHAVPSSTAP